jgi:UDP-glucose 4-epimerase
LTTPRYLVLGGSGFLGSHVIRRLARRGHLIRVFGRQPQTFERNLGDVAGVSFCQGDVACPRDIEAALTSITHVVYLVAASVPATSMRDVSCDLRANVLPLIRFLETLAAHPTVQRLVYVSSGGTVYGNPEAPRPITESHPTSPISSYGLTKLIGEHYVRLCLRRSAVRAYVLRPSNAYGERQTPHPSQGVVGLFLRTLARAEPVTIYGNGATVRDYLYAGDLARAVELCLDDGAETAASPMTFNVGSGVGTSIADLIATMEEVVGARFSVRHEPDRGFDCTYNVLDSSHIREHLGWQAQVPLREGLLRTWAWLRRGWE